MGHRGCNPGPGLLIKPFDTKEPESQQHSDPVPYRGQRSLAGPSQSSWASTREEMEANKECVPRPRVRETLAGLSLTPSEADRGSQGVFDRRFVCKKGV